MTNQKFHFLFLCSFSTVLSFFHPFYQLYIYIYVCVCVCVRVCVVLKCSSNKKFDKVSSGAENIHQKFYSEYAWNIRGDTGSAG